MSASSRITRRHCCGSIRDELSPMNEAAVSPTVPRRAVNLRRRHRDDLGLRLAMPARALPFLVAAITFLAALALIGAIGAAVLAARWQVGAAAALTVQVPRPTQPAEPGPVGREASSRGLSRLDRVVSLLQETPGVASVQPMSTAQIAELLRPWLGGDATNLAVPLPAIIQVHSNNTVGVDARAAEARLAQAAPGTSVEDHGVLVGRLARFASVMEALAYAALAAVVVVAVAVIAIAVGSGLAARRDAIEILHGLGATDAFIATRFAARAARLAGLGGVFGAGAAVIVVVMVASLIAPLVAADGGDPAGEGALAALGAVPGGFWLALPALPGVAALIGLATAQATVRLWLRRLR
jgi:cell division transport system permease protein